MGMDVYARNPKSDDEGHKYFRANCWSWRPIHELMRRLCADILPAQMLDSMSYNDGAGPESQETCDEIAARTESWLEQQTPDEDGIVLYLPCRDEMLCVAEQEPGREGWRRFLSPMERTDARVMATAESPYAVSADHLRQWIRFLRECGGFEVH